MTEEKRIGRPPEEGVKRSEKLEIRLTPEEKENLRSGAKNADKQLTEWARSVLLAAAKK